MLKNKNYKNLFKSKPKASVESLNSDYSNKSENLIGNKESCSIEKRYLCPKNFKRVEVEKNSFSKFLRNSKLLQYGKKVKLHNGREKNSDNIYDSVFDVEIGSKDLHQCADAIMLLRAEYLYAEKDYKNLNFHFVNGFKAEFSKWIEGYRISVDNNSNTAKYIKKEPYNSDYPTFRKYMIVVMAYASTLSLEKEMIPVNIKNMKIGDVFIKGGNPGHAVIVVDMCQNDEGKKLFMLAQSYMPAQQTQILVNNSNKKISPWYELKEETLITPEWTFDKNSLRRFQN